MKDDTNNNSLLSDEPRYDPDVINQVELEMEAMDEEDFKMFFYDRRCDELQAAVGGYKTRKETDQ